MVLPDLLRPGLRIVFVGTAVGLRSAERGHYYAGPGNEFWNFLHEAGLTSSRLSADHDVTLPDLGLGLTDLTKSVAQSHDRGLPYDFAAFDRKMSDCRRGVVAFTSKRGGEVYARYVGQRLQGLGPADWTVSGRPAYVLPSPSAANRTPTNPPRVEWWRRLADFVQNNASPPDGTTTPVS